MYQNNIYELYQIIDDAFCPLAEMRNTTEKLVDAGVTCVQLRMKNSIPADIIAIGNLLLPILRTKNIPLIINDHIELAKQLDADGVHIGQGDVNPIDARNYLGKNKIIGLSIETLEQAKQAINFDVDYFGVGPIFTTSSKLDAAIPIGTEQLKLIANILNKPIVAIGGINLQNLPAVLNTGVKGIAIISATLCAEDPVKTIQQFKQELFYVRNQYE